MLSWNEFDKLVAVGCNGMARRIIELFVINVLLGLGENFVGKFRIVQSVSTCGY